MSPFWSLMARLNLSLWVSVVLVLHLVFYLATGARHWVLATLAATITYGILFGALKSYARRRQRSDV